MYDTLGLTLQMKVNSSTLYFAEQAHETNVRDKGSHCQEVVVAYHDSARQKQLVTIQSVPPNPHNDSTNVEAMLVLASVVHNDCFSYSSILELLGHRGIHEGQWVNRSLKLWETSVGFWCALDHGSSLSRWTAAI